MLFFLNYLKQLLHYNNQEIAFCFIVVCYKWNIYNNNNKKKKAHFSAPPLPK